MIAFNPLSGLFGRLIAATTVQTSTVSLSAAAPGALPASLAFQKQRASFSSALAFAVSLSLFGSLGALTGCGRTGLLGPEDDAPVARDAGVGGDGNTHDAGVSDAGTDSGIDAGTVNPASISDLDCDGVPDLLDNCPQSPNANQADTDGDGIGDVCDNDSINPDSDGDGLLDGLELFQLGSNPTVADTDGDGNIDSEDACPITAGPLSSQGCQPSPPTCAIESAPLPNMSLCDGTVVDGFRILWNVGNAGTASLKEGSLELTRRHTGQIYVYPTDSRTYEISAHSLFGDCADSITVTP